MSEDSDLTFPQIHGIAHADDAEAMSAKAELAEALQKACEWAVNNVPGYVSAARAQWTGPSSTSFANELDDIDKSVNNMNDIIVGYPKGINNIAATIRTFKDDTDALAKEYEADLQEAADADEGDFDDTKSALREEYNKKARRIMRNTVEQYQSANSSSISEPVEYDAVKTKNAPSPRPEFTKLGTAIAAGVFAAKASKLGPALHNATKNPWGKFENGVKLGANKLGSGIGAGVNVADQTMLKDSYYTAPNLQSGGPTLAPPNSANAAPGPQLQGPATNPTMPMLGPLQSQSPAKVGPNANARNGQQPRTGQTVPPGGRPTQPTPPAFTPNTATQAARPAFPAPTVENGNIVANPAGTATNGPAVGPGANANPGAGSSAPRTPGMPMRPSGPTTMPPPRPDHTTQPTQQVSRPPRIGAPSLRMGTSGNNDNRSPARFTPKRSGHVTVGTPRGNGEWGRNPWARKPDSVNPTRPVRRASIAPKTNSGTWGNNPWARRPTASSVPRAGCRPVVRPGGAHATGKTPRHSWGRNPWVRPEKGNTFYPPLRARKRKDDKDETEANVYDSQAEIDDDEAELKEAPLSAPVLSRLLAQASPQERQRIIAIEAKKLGIAQSPSSGPADNTSDNAGAKQAGKEPMASSTR